MAIFVIFPSIHNPSKFLITRFFLNFDNFPIYHLSSFLESGQFLITAILIIFLPPLDAIILSFFLSFFEISYKFFPSPSPSPFFDPRNFTRDRSLPAFHQLLGLEKIQFFRHTLITRIRFVHCTRKRRKKKFQIPYSLFPLERNRSYFPENMTLKRFVPPSTITRIPHSS